jgi:predicted nucleic acid-binding protein
VSLYLDASAIVPIFVAERASTMVTAYMAAAVDTLIVNEFAAAEVASGLSRLARMGTLNDEAADTRLNDFDAWRAGLTQDEDLQAADFRLASLFVRRFELALRAPDAVHLAVCRRGDHTLVTLDKRLAAAAEALGVRVTCLA